MSEDCPHCIFEKTEANCRGCFEGSHYRPKPITNYDCIVSKTPEDLAEWIAEIADHGGGRCAPGCYDCTAKTCESAWLDWLKQEAQ